MTFSLSSSRSAVRSIFRTGFGTGVGAGLVLVPLFASIAACSSDADGTVPPVDDGGISLGDDGGYVDADLPSDDKPRVDGGFEGPDGSVLREDRFITQVVSFTPGDCAGFGAGRMPAVVQGPPIGGGELTGGFDVVSFGTNGEMVLSFEGNAIVDGPGVDFIVFENAFWAAGNAGNPFADLAEVSVSDDGTTWSTFPCVVSEKAPYGACAGWHPVYSTPSNGISPFDPTKAGGDPYDLADLGLARARFVRIRDLGTTECPATSKPTNAGFDLDALAIMNAEKP